MKKTFWRTTFEAMLAAKSVGRKEKTGRMLFHADVWPKYGGAMKSASENQIHNTKFKTIINIDLSFFDQQRYAVFEIGRIIGKSSRLPLSFTPSSKIEAGKWSHHEFCLPALSA